MVMVMVMVPVQNVGNAEFVSCLVPSTSSSLFFFVVWIQLREHRDEIQSTDSSPTVLDVFSNDRFQLPQLLSELDFTSVICLFVCLSCRQIRLLVEAFIFSSNLTKQIDDRQHISIKFSLHLKNYVLIIIGMDILISLSRHQFGATFFTDVMPSHVAQMIKKSNLHSYVLCITRVRQS